jgi:multiple sugar transport system permease protein
MAYNKNAVGYVFVLPSLCVMLFFIIIPLIFSFISSFFDFTIMLDKFDFIGLKNYQQVFADQRFWNSMKNTLYFTSFMVPLSNALSLLVALAVHKTNKKNVVFRTIFFLPVVCSMTIIALSLSMMFDFNIGILPALLRKMGLPAVDLLRDPNLAMPAVIGISIYKCFGFNMVIFIAALQGVPSYLYEAADIDGAASGTKFFKVTLPFIAPTVTFTLITSMISSFQVFDQVYVTTKGGPLFRTETVVQFIYERAFQTYEMGFADANAVILFILILTATLVLRRLRRDEENNF